MSTQNPDLAQQLNDWQGVHADIMADRTRELDIEGALNTAKTTLCLDKVLAYLKEFAGIWAFIFRYSQNDTETKLQPAFEQICKLRNFIPHWESKEKYYSFENNSRCYSFGLKAVDALSRYSKLRGLGIAIGYGDQAEEIPHDIAEEMRARLRQRGYPHQLIWSPNPPNKNHWLAKRDSGFPLDNSVQDRRYYSISIYQNAYNLPPESVRSLERTYPPGHAKHQSLVLGKRGINVTGEAIYKDVFHRSIHERPIVTRADAPIVEAFCFGKSHPCYIAAQRTPTGGVHFLAGVLGQDLFIADFVPAVKVYRREWFGDDAVFDTCYGATSAEAEGLHNYGEGDMLRAHGFDPTARADSNSPDVRVTMMEYLADLMRRRLSTGDEAIGVNSDESRWLRISREGVESWPFLAEGFEAGYVKDEHFVSVGNKQVRQPKADDWFEMGQRCAEYIALNFCAGKSPTPLDAVPVAPYKPKSAWG